jgi:hypothetical protein
MGKTNKFVYCNNCKKSSDCERTYFGGCTDGEEWVDEMDNKEFLEQAKAYKRLKTAFAELEKAHTEYWKTMKPEPTWRNTKLSFWREICLKYDEKDLLNCYGDIFFIDDHYGDTYVGRRVLWNLELSKEQYEIRCEDENDSDGEYEWTNYEIEVIKD